MEKTPRGIYEFKCELENRMIMSDRGNAVVGRAYVNRPNVARNDEVGFAAAAKNVDMKLQEYISLSEEFNR